MNNTPIQKNEDQFGSYHTADDHIEEYPEIPNITELDLLLDKLPLEIGGHRLQIWREKDNTSWDVAYNTDSGNLEEMVWEQDRYLSGAVDKMLKRLTPQR